MEIKKLMKLKKALIQVQKAEMDLYSEINTVKNEPTRQLYLEYSYRLFDLLEEIEKQFKEDTKTILKKTN